MGFFFINIQLCIEIAIPKRNLLFFSFTRLNLHLKRVNDIISLHWKKYWYHNHLERSRSVAGVKTLWGKFITSTEFTHNFQFEHGVWFPHLHEYPNDMFCIFINRPPVTGIIYTISRRVRDSCYLTPISPLLFYILSPQILQLEFLPPSSGIPKYGNEVSVA